MQRTAFVLLIVQTVDRRLGVFVALEFDEAESLALSGVAIGDHVGAADGAEWREQGFEVGARNVVAEIAAIKLLTHRNFSHACKA